MRYLQLNAEVKPHSSALEVSAAHRRVKSSFLTASGICSSNQRHALTAQCMRCLQLTTDWREGVCSSEKVEVLTILSMGCLSSTQREVLASGRLVCQQLREDPPICAHKVSAAQKR
jgi:hypothetical protein